MKDTNEDPLHKKRNAIAGTGEKNTDTEANKCINVVRIESQRGGLFVFNACSQNSS